MKISNRLVRTAMLSVGILLSSMMAGCHGASSPPLPTESRGRVIDQETGEAIPGAIVVAQYLGSIAWGGGACNRVESAIADERGEFSVPLDKRFGPLSMEAYKRGYVYGGQGRYAVKLKDDAWQVWVAKKWDKGKVTEVDKEPTIYRTEREAKEASREDKDVYLKKSRGTREQRLMELSGLAGQAICGGGAIIHGPFEFLDAIYQEQLELGDREDGLRHTRSIAEMAQQDMQAARERENAGRK
jgi:hypothetical protein